MAEAEVQIAGRRGWRPGGDIGTELHRHRRRAFAWITVAHDDEETLSLIESRLGLSRRAIVAADASQLRTRVDRVEGAEVLALATVRMGEGGQVRRGEVTCLVAPGCAVTAESGDGAVLEAAREILSSGAARLSLGPAAVLRAVAIAVVEAAEQINVDLAEEVEKLESRVFSPAGIGSAEGIYRLGRQIAAARRALTPLSATLTRVAGRDDASLPAGALQTLRSLAGAADHCVEQIDELDRMLGDMLSAHLTMVSVRQNTDMRRISALAALVAIPTMLAGLYGMNFTHMPGLDWPWSFPFALGAVAVLCIVLHRLLKRAGWL